MDFKKIDDSDINYFQKLVGFKGVLTSDEVLANYSHDETEDLIYFPEVVTQPEFIQSVRVFFSSPKK